MALLLERSGLALRDPAGLNLAMCVRPKSAGRAAMRQHAVAAS